MSSCFTVIITASRLPLWNRLPFFWNSAGSSWLILPFFFWNWRKGNAVSSLFFGKYRYTVLPSGCGKLGGICNSTFQLLPLLLGGFSVLALFQAIYCQFHDSYALQTKHLISQIFTHSADLPVQSLGKNNPKRISPCFFHKTRTGNGIQNRNSRWQNGRVECV